ncbi:MULTISPECIES: (d)CMP kinase [unclassified Rhodococcus (in: high G+C Gram-positive bacteria)]|uniref:(d)CMP kinase n=1 Tax=unclassified Rhodococcus (in: high G+C Gram-positive bacteria) TaxID=192944 RepID=UPI001D188AAA|nr:MULTISPECIES: (d)CMP kinase [unclassified Rhodococcus (in: high G+C Gram-positive bacteria)]MCC4306292.1 (d)CMP kinase [Rhodococcus sp. 3-2]
MLADRLGIFFFSTGLVIRFLAQAYQQLADRGVSHEEIMPSLYGRVSADTVLYLQNRNNADLYDDGLVKYFASITGDGEMLRHVNTALDDYRRGRDLIMDGRNLFEIFPDAEFKFYFESTPQRRAEILQQSKRITRSEALERQRLRDDQERTFNVPRRELIVLDPLSHTLDDLIETMHREVARGAGETELFELLDCADVEMKANEDAFFDLWNSSIRENLGCSSSFRIQDHVSACGGFRLRLPEVDLLVPTLRDFFLSRGHVEGETVWLRGYAYYECDPHMHERRSGSTESSLWQTFCSHWRAYSEPAFACEGEPWTSNVVNWIGTLSYLEYVFNDLTTMLWFVYSNESRLDGIRGSSQIAPTIEACVGEIADMIASLLLFRYPASTDGFPQRIADVVLNPTISAFVDESSRISHLVPGSVRAVREGDSLPVLFAAYTTKLAAFGEGLESDRVLILSNAFGALNQGVIFQRLTSDRWQAEHVNVQYSQHRADGPDLGERSGAVRVFRARSMARMVEDYRDRCVIVVDDCIFTGKSFHEIRGVFDPGTEVVPLPLMLDTQSLRYHRRETRDPQEAYRTAKVAVMRARELGDRLPAFEAFWDWSTPARTAPHDQASDFDEVMSGGDVLLRTLWSRFRQQILPSPAKEGP